MKPFHRYVWLIVPCLIWILIIQIAPAHGQFGKMLESIKGVLVPNRISENEIINGLKEALQVGTSNAVTSVSQPDGFFKNPAIRIPLPESVRKIQPILNASGFGSYVDDFEISMNRAAEKAAPQAKSLFLDAVSQMTIEDARRILDGGDTAATDYFRTRTSEPLGEIFKPIVSRSMGDVGVTRSFQDMNMKVQSIPFAGRLSIDLDQYVTGKTLDGLFFMLAEEEKKIRQNPAARTTDLLKRVFGERK